MTTIQVATHLYGSYSTVEGFNFVFPLIVLKLYYFKIKGGNVVVGVVICQLLRLVVYKPLIVFADNVLFLLKTF